MRALVQQGFERNAVDQVHGVEYVALGLAHLLALRVQHQAVDVDVPERHAACEVGAHHDHPGDPEEDDVVARDQHAAGQVEVVVVGGRVALVGPAHGAEGDEGAGIPGVQHVGIALQSFAGGLRLGFLFVLGDVDLAVLVVPRRNLVAPPQLAADAPVLDVVHPLVVGIHPVFRHELHLAAGDRVDGLLRDGLACGVARAFLGHLVHGEKPLVGQHRLDHLPGAGADGHHQLVFFRLDQQAQGFQIGHDGLAGGEAIQSPVFFRCVVVDGGGEREHADHRQAMALAHGIVVLVVRGGDLHHAGAEGAVDVFIGNHRDFALAQRQLDALADQVLVALVLGMHHHRHVAQHGFRAGGGNDELARAVGQGVGDVPQRAVFFLVLHLQVGHGGLQHRVPVHQPLAAVNQPLFVQLDKGFGDDFGELVVHGEVFAAPVHRVAQAAHLRGDGVAGFFLPFPHFLHEFGAAQVVAADALLLQLALHHDLRGNARVVGAGNPGGVVPQHAVVARQAVHDGLVEGMAHVQCARHVGRRQLDGEGRGAGIRLARAAHTGVAVAALFPLWPPMGFQGGGFKGFGEALQAGLGRGIAHGCCLRVRNTCKRHPAGCRRMMGKEGRRMAGF